MTVFVKTKAHADVNDQIDICGNLDGLANEGLGEVPFDPTLVIGYVDHATFRLWL